VKYFNFINFKVLIFFTLTIFSFLSFSNNYFNVANNNWYINFSTGSEQLVLDGILYASDGAKKIKLGKYKRDDNFLTNHTKNKYNFENKIISQDFLNYDSQFGLQISFFYLLNKLGFDQVNHLQFINCLIFSLLLSSIFLMMTKEFTILSSLTLPILFSLSPWVVVFSKNLYWVQFTWMLPFVVSMFFLSINKIKGIYLIIYFFLLTISFMVKFLSGYEYNSTVGIFSTIPFFLYYFKNKIKITQLSKLILISFISFLLAFSFSILIHAKSISNAQSFHQSIIFIISNAKVRLDNPNFNDLSKYCEKNKFLANIEKTKDCIELISKEKNILKIIIRYLVFNNFLPWTSIMYDNIYLDDVDKEKIKKINNKISLTQIIKIYSDLKISTIFKLFDWLIGSFLFFTLIITSFFLTSIRGKLLLSISILSPISWFFLAPNHSYFHFGLNYILWYFPLIPVCFITIFENPYILKK
tara:strand:- start:3517 stop:4926 length:1410 start_codon:yes stop_codon:yes gene_type:complete